MEPPERGDVDGIFEWGQRGLTGEVLVLRLSAADQFEDRIAAERVMVVAVFVAGQNSVDALADHLAKGMVGEILISRIVEAGDETIREADLVIELPDG